MTFEDFIYEMPGLERYAIDLYRSIDRRAEKLGAELRKRDVPSLRARAADPALTPNLRAPYTAMGNALERDPTGRLAAIPSLYAWAMKSDGIGQHWITWYRNLVNAWIDAQKAPSLVPAMATEPEIEEVS